MANKNNTARYNSKSDCTNACRPLMLNMGDQNSWIRQGQWLPLTSTDNAASFSLSNIYAFKKSHVKTTAVLNTVIDEQTNFVKDNLWVMISAGKYFLSLQVP